jgi:hypothetical protein
VLEAEATGPQAIGRWGLSFRLPSRIQTIPIPHHQLGIDPISACAELHRIRSRRRRRAGSGIHKPWRGGPASPLTTPPSSQSSPTR